MQVRRLRDLKALYRLRTVLRRIKRQTASVTYFIGISIVDFTEFSFAFRTRRKVFVVLFKFKPTADRIAKQIINRLIKLPLELGLLRP